MTRLLLTILLCTLAHPTLAAKGTRSEFQSELTTKVNDNTAGDITPQDIREVLTSLEDSTRFLEEDNYIELDCTNDLDCDGGNAAANKTAIQGAIDTLVGNGGGVLKLPPGEIDINGDIAMDHLSTDDTVIKPVHVIGEQAPDGVFVGLANRASGNFGTFLHLQDNTSLFKIRSSWSSVQRIVVDAPDLSVANRDATAAIEVGAGASLVPSDNTDVSADLTIHVPAFNVLVKDLEIRRVFNGIFWRDGQRLHVDTIRCYDIDHACVYMPSGYFDNNHGIFKDMFVSNNGAGFYNDEQPYQAISNVDTASNELTVVGHSYAADVNEFKLKTTGTLPSPLEVGVDYYIESVTGDEFTLSATNGGAQIDITDSGTGTHYIQVNDYTSNSHVFEGSIKTFSNGDETLTFTANASTDVATWTGGKVRFETGDGPVRLFTTGTLPAGLSTGTDYWTVWKGAEGDGTGAVAFATSESNALAGTIVDITDTGTGTHSMDQLGCGAEWWGDSWQLYSFFVEANDCSIHARPEANRVFGFVLGDNSNPAPDNMTVEDSATSALCGNRPGFGPVCKNWRTQDIEITGQNPFGGGARMYHSASNTVTIEGTRNSTGTQNFIFSEGPMDTVTLKLGDDGVNLRRIAGQATHLSITTSDIGTVSANSVVSVSKTLPFAQRDNAVITCSTTNTNTDFDDEFILHSVSTTDTTPDASTAVTVKIANITGSSQTQSADVRLNCIVFAMDN